MFREIEKVEERDYFRVLILANLILIEKKGKCKVISNHWGCILHKKIKEDYEINDEIVFQVGLEDIVVPFEFMKMIEYKILKKVLWERACFYLDIEFKNSKYIQCRNEIEIYKALPKEIEFCFYGFTVNIPFERLYTFSLMRILFLFLSCTS